MEEEARAKGLSHLNTNNNSAIVAGAGGVGGTG